MDKKSEGFWPVVFLVFGLLALALHSLYEDLLKAALLRWLGGFVGVGEAELMGRLTEMAVPIAGAIAVLSFFYWFLKREFARGKIDPAIEAQRQQTEAILAHTEALKAKPHGVTLAASGDRSSAVALAGIVNALMEQALQYGFKMTAMQPGDPFIQRYQEVKTSIDPVWIDEETGRLRRDFLQFCAVVGSEDRGVKVLQSDRAELRKHGKQLIGKLTEVGRAEFRKPTPTWLELERRFQELEPLLQYTRVDGQTG